LVFVPVNVLLNLTLPLAAVSSDDLRERFVGARVRLLDFVAQRPNAVGQLAQAQLKSRLYRAERSAG
jgi:hypothetical protein